jgi:thiamine biosynthesis lipoprotein ApbE
MRPADSPVVSASVVASTAVEAEAGAKAVLFHGVDGLAWADRQPWIRRAIVIWHDGCVYANREKEKP